jgi:uncharacterized membrane protein SpoIIM required for sporulation
MFMNGLILGGVLGLSYYYGSGPELTNFLIGHAVVELSVIAIAGGAGLRLGWAILQPGMIARATALRRASGEALRLVVLCIFMLVAAGLIEGLISTAEEIPALIKWLTGAGSGGLMFAYLMLSGRPSADLKASSSLQFKIAVDN